MAGLEKRLAEQRRGKGRSVIAVLGILLAVLAVAGASYVWFSGGIEQSKEKGSIVTPQNKINIMVMGVDERSDDTGRSDTLFVVTIDTNTKDVAMLSIPRDTRVKIPGHGWDKINHAYAYGGHKLTQQAVEGLLGIKMDHYITINIAGFKKIIDAVGGVTIDVEKRMYYSDPYDDNGEDHGPFVIDLRPGVQRMDGRMAIQYVRYRDEEGDIGRVERQQKFLKALMKEVASPSVITKIPAIVREVNSVVNSDMSTTEMLNLAKTLNDASKNGLRTDMVPGKPAFINEISYWLPDVMALRKHVAQTLGVAMEEKYVATTQKDASEYETSIPKEMKVVETPKVAKNAVPEKKTPDKSKKDDKNDKTDASADAGKSVSKKANSDKVSVEVVNASGMADAGDKIAAILRNRGFEVEGVTNTANAYKNTVVISNTTDSRVVNKLSSLPFKYSLQITKDEGKAIDAVVVVGKDYTGK
ncbi:LCP family protein [Pelosinus fermentans]|uniref:Cell envelope-related transcriptional attenuator n=1 Tax=Pelosinus fermentans JBW45 TaxID=1192197 RepID=I9NW81_9FIRM|nr:LCP family protein [Pelosinus fermentans]AJQ29823.1 cell envelope-related transcriptional attenuator [Pelosinus fermentans JBW45]